MPLVDVLTQLRVSQPKLTPAMKVTMAIQPTPKRPVRTSTNHPSKSQMTKTKVDYWKVTPAQLLVIWDSASPKNKRKSPSPATTFQSSMTSTTPQQARLWKRTKAYISSSDWQIKWKRSSRRSCNRSSVHPAIGIAHPLNHRMIFGAPAPKDSSSSKTPNQR